MGSADYSLAADHSLSPEETPQPVKLDRLTGECLVAGMQDFPSKPMQLLDRLIAMLKKWAPRGENRQYYWAKDRYRLFVLTGIAMKKFKRSLPFLLWFIIITEAAYRGVLISINETNWLVNLCQLIALMLIIFQSYFLIEMLIRKKVNLQVLNQIQRRKSTKHNRVFFLARLEHQQERIVSLASSNLEFRSDMAFKGYYTFNNKLKVIDPYVVRYRILLLILGVLIISLSPLVGRFLSSIG